MPNRLAQESSPYLLQHAENPVDWYPWGQEAFDKARKEDKPILLSIGYSSCHWCHVMAHESFENPDIAKIMNDNFVNIKVDREERPDIDAIYMEAVQAMTGQAGWPLTVFLTPDGKPFFGGTYFPPEDRVGMPGFKRLLLWLSEVYHTRRQEIEQSASQIAQQLLQISRAELKSHDISLETLESACQNLKSSFDHQYGGFGTAPKFPQPMTVEYLLQSFIRAQQKEYLDMVTLTLDRMSLGGIHDHLGGGFHRYSVDRTWLIPHFEKMLYDQALIARAYLHAWQVTHNSWYLKVVNRTLQYVLKDMTSSQGGFYSAQDADSEGEEGKYYLWSLDEIKRVLNEREVELVCEHYGVTASGNFEGKNILHIAKSIEDLARDHNMVLSEVEKIIDEASMKLLHYRDQRTPPAKDTKVVTSWNALMSTTLAEAGFAMNNPEYIAASQRNAQFLLDNLVVDGLLHHTYSDSKPKVPGFLEDYAALSNSLITLYEITSDGKWLESARRFVQDMIDSFWKEEIGTFSDTSIKHSDIFLQPRNLYDNATPSGNSLACMALLRLAVIFNRQDYREIASRVVRGLAPVMSKHPTAFGHMLCVANTLLSPSVEIVILGDKHSVNTEALLEVIRQTYIPNKILISTTEEEASRSDLPLLQGRTLRKNKPTAFVCRNYACSMPVNEPYELREQLTLQVHAP